MRTLIKNGYVVSMVSDIRKTDILIEDDKIVRIGTVSEENETFDKVIDASNMVVMPGLVNAHTHVAMSIFRGYNDELELMNWLQEMWKIEDRMKKEDIYYASMISGIEMIKSGTTTFNDLYFFEEETAKMAEQLGLRAILSRAVIGEGDDCLIRVRESEELYHSWHNKCDGRIKVCVGIHAPYTCPPDTIKKSLELADRLGTPVHIHYLETKDEVEKIFNVYHKSVTDYLKELGLFNYHVILAHGVHVNDRDMEILKNISGGIVHNPISNMKLGSGFAPVKKMRERGINVALGTDGQGGTNTMDMFEEIKLATYLQKGLLGSATAMSAKDALQMATIEGAKVLGLDSEVGSLEVGKKADIIIIDINKPHLKPHHDIYSLLAYSVNGADVDTTIIDGNVVMEHRNVMNVDENEILEKVELVKNKLF
ncbi:MAG: amidohydrolase [Clostridia bacterium]|nr:amidohydrolase [Clostridia bacterium]